MWAIRELRWLGFEFSVLKSRIRKQERNSGDYYDG